MLFCKTQLVPFQETSFNIKTFAKVEYDEPLSN